MTCPRYSNEAVVDLGYSWLTLSCLFWATIGIFIPLLKMYL